MAQSLFEQLTSNINTEEKHSKSKNDKSHDKDTINNLSDSLYLLSKNLLKKVQSEPSRYSIKELRDIASILSSLRQDSGEVGDGSATPASPVALNVFYNKELSATKKESMEDSESDVTTGLDKMSEEDIKNLLDSTNDIQNDINTGNIK